MGRAEAFFACRSFAVIFDDQSSCKLSIFENCVSSQREMALSCSFSLSISALQLNSLVFSASQLNSNFQICQFCPVQTFCGHYLSVQPLYHTSLLGRNLWLHLCLYVCVCARICMAQCICVCFCVCLCVCMHIVLDRCVFCPCRAASCNPAV